MENTTIAAISTPFAPGGIGIVRLSGPRSVEVADRLFHSQKGKRLSDRPTHTLTYGSICDPADGQLVDECLVSVMRAPRTYTGEDVCEINCHGGLYVCDKVLRLCLEQGAVLAQPGEFTKRAFLNGRMDLSRAEAVIDLIEAESGGASRNAAAQMGGQMARRITQLREALVRVSADILVEVEYPEEDTPHLAEEETLSRLQELESTLRRLYGSFEAGRAIRDGIQTAIVGRPNVGKSSILNLLAGYDKAIVTDIAGTTRDVVEEKIRLGDVLLRLYDTAGIRSTGDRVEQLGVERSMALLEQAELIFYVVDSSQPLTGEDETLLEKLDPQRTVVLLNKQDLQPAVAREDIPARFQQVVWLSAQDGQGMDRLEQVVRQLCLRGIDGLEQGEIVTNARQRECLLRAHESVQQALTSLGAGMPFDLITIDLQDAIDALGEITGETASEAIIGDIFSRFCLGK
ncbi:MAG: tRNA uridine-5-carboxymethylaminomethyl(34) synthesis GTPase MnmE [Eubacteriales bacterium]|jgi:tRNA modification GTPase